MWKRNFGSKTFVFSRLERVSFMKEHCSLYQGILHTELSVRIGRAVIQAGNGMIRIHRILMRIFFSEHSGYGRDFSRSTSLFPYPCKRHNPLYCLVVKKQL
jgi:hypothetical protein